MVVFLVLCGGGAAGGYWIFNKAKDTVEDVADKVNDADRISVVEPKTLGGRARSTDPGLAKTVNELKSGMAADLPGATSSVAAYYGSAEKKNLTMAFAVSVLNPAPQAALDAFTSAATSQLGKVTFEKVEPGPLGGLAQCGQGAVSGVPVAICVWADNGSVGMIMYFAQNFASIKTKFAAERGEVEKKATA
ncbi:hypothetical protein QEZ54_04150 [Catellatospora sp. KI3]|uniref:hypothetical protein n=1 Tax=Catellatospora sp. KI3 TaxID=3041620 RepID=UPI002482962C|nr:hypothetical protein [Catellatospora sp. KI3]MDI1460153.1 hypothetical protein [Catellatospora sp. KI3]